MPRDLSVTNTFDREAREVKRFAAAFLSVIVLLTGALAVGVSTSAAHPDEGENPLRRIDEYAAGSNGSLAASDIASYANNLGGPSTPSFGPVAEFNNWRLHVSCAALGSTRFVVAYRRLLENDGAARVGAVSGRDITWGPEQVFNDASTSKTSITGISATRFAIAWREEEGAGYGRAIIGDVSQADNSLTFHTPATFNSAGTDYISAVGLSSTDLVIAYQDTPISGKAIAGDVGVDGTLTFDPD